MQKPVRKQCGPHIKSVIRAEDLKEVDEHQTGVRKPDTAVGSSMTMMTIIGELGRNPTWDLGYRVTEVTARNMHIRLQ
ncbi:hypothetical protein DPMN_032507 [Dreissena polymorpha]|uniref:Uncharacterized protein n=1 Tax=Dreissena polymorpha TaxID=45954 RepID=A0A9D4M431_DREPO|nr:hypothetical protein DPMN_032507 [Dreissena polymorpha]